MRITIAAPPASARDRGLAAAAAALLAVAPLAAPPLAAEVRLREVAREWGLEFRHHHGGSGRYFQPETDGSGVILFDYDGDGDVDVLLLDGGALPGWEGPAPANRLARNDGGGRFTTVTAPPALPTGALGMGGVAGDVDGDGDPDLYLTAFGPNRLFLNTGDGGFDEVAEAGGAVDERWSSSTALADVDLDGDLDLYVVNYLDYALDRHKVCTDPKTRIVGYCHPGFLDGVGDRFFRNRGDGTFEEATAAAGLDVEPGKGLGVVFADLDADRLPDLYVANDTTPNFLFRNLGGGRFEDLSLLSGTAYGDRTLPEAGMGIALGDVDGNGFADLFVTNYALETNALYRNLGNGLFSEGRHVAGVAEPSIPMLGFGTAFADFDADGDLDLAVANGHVLDRIEEMRPGITYRQVNQLFEQGAGGRFRVVDAGFETARVSRGLAVGDLDGDGDPDLVISNSNDLAEVYENVSPGGGWVAFDLVGRGANTAAIGAALVLEAGGRRQHAEALTASSYLSQNAATLHFGLGREPRPPALAVRWPDGASTRYAALPVNRRLRLYR